MEITLHEAPDPFGGSDHHAWCSLVVRDTRKPMKPQRFLSGLNLIRPIGPSLSGLPAPRVVRNVSSVMLGKIERWDPNLEVPGSLVFPVVPIALRLGFNLGGKFVVVENGHAGLHLGSDSANPAVLPSVKVDSSNCRPEDNWTLNDPNNLMVQLPILRAVVGGGVDRGYEGGLAVLTDQTGVDSVAMILDVEPLAGGGSNIAIARIKDIFEHPSFSEVVL